jgi:hypothetical protein
VNDPPCTCGDEERDGGPGRRRRLALWLLATLSTIAAGVMTGLMLEWIGALL